MSSGAFRRGSGLYLIQLVSSAVIIVSSHPPDLMSGKLSLVLSALVVGIAFANVVSGNWIQAEDVLEQEREVEEKRKEALLEHLQKVLEERYEKVSERS